MPTTTAELSRPPASNVGGGGGGGRLLDRLLQFGERREEKLAEVVRNVLTMKNNADSNATATVTPEVKASTTVTLNRLALSKFLNDLREENRPPVSELPQHDRKVDFGKDKHVKGILNREFGKDGDRLKMKVIEDEEAIAKPNQKPTVTRATDSTEKRPSSNGRSSDEDGRRTKDGRRSKDGTSAVNPRKVSFKVNKASGGNRRNKVMESRVVLNSSKVAALASKYNSLIDNVDTSKANDGTIFIKTPNQKQDIKVVVSRKSSSVKRDNSTASSFKNGNKKAVEDVAAFGKNKDKKNISIKYKPPVLKSRSGNVRAAIQIFEQNSTIIRVKSTGNFSREDKANSDLSGKENGEGKENIKTVRASEEPTKNVLPRFSTLYKDYNKEFKQQTSANVKRVNGALKSSVGEKLNAGRGQRGADGKGVAIGVREVTCDEDATTRDDRGQQAMLVENKSTLYSGQLRYGTAGRTATASRRSQGAGFSDAKTAEVDVGGEESGVGGDGDYERFANGVIVVATVSSSTAKEDLRGRSGKAENGDDGHYETVRSCGESGQNVVDRQQPDRKISRITKKVISFPTARSRAKLSSPERKASPATSESVEELRCVGDTSLRSAPTRDGDAAATGDAVEDYEKICVGDSATAEDYETLQETSSNAEVYERVFPVAQKEVTAAADPPLPRVQPNSSFLWGSSAPLPQPPAPGDIEVHDLYAYDDVYPPYDLCNADPLHYSSVKIEDIYDDIRCDVKESDIDVCANYDVIGNRETLLVTVSNKTDSAEETASCRYDYVSSRPGEAAVSTNNYQDLEDNIYDDVKTLSTKEDAMSISNCYESIYDGGGNGSVKEAVNSLYGGAVGKGESSGGSSVSSKSYCDQSNSLYGGLPGARFGSATASQASTASVEGTAHEVLSYQLTSLGVSKSDTSDEWVDMEPSDSETERGTINLVVYDRSRCRRSPSWSEKVKRQWSKSPRTFAGASVFVSSASVHYLGELQHRYNGSQSNAFRPHRSQGFVSLRAIIYNEDIHETQEVTFFLDKEGGDSSDDSDHHYEMLDDVVDKAPNTDIPYDDFDSFDSDSSEDPPVPSKPLDGYNSRLPEPPAAQNIYGITKIAEAAGNKLLQLRKSLSKMRPKRHTTEIRLSNSIPPPLSAAPPLPPAPLEKTTSSGNLSNKKYWSLRKFRRSSSTVSQSASKFYITDTVDVDTGQIENDQKRHSVVSESSEISNGHEATSPSSSKTSMNEVGVENGVRKNSKPAIYERRQSARPNSPPPLPPPLANSECAPKRPNRKDKRSTSWYAECGLFDGSDSNLSEAKRNANKERLPSNSWYAEVGLWDEVSSASQPNSLTQEQTDLNSSAETSDCSMSPENSGVERRFIDEPLYQFYTASIVELARRDMSGEFDSDGYEEIGDRGPKLGSRPSAMELIQPREGLHRTLWCQIPEVIDSRILDTISTHQKKLQEAKFEIIASEASYFKSLNVLEKHFIGSPEFNDETVLSKSDRRILFSNVAPVKNCSKRFLAELEKCWQDNILLTGICDVIYKFATDNFNSYIKYCSNQIYLDRTLRRLKEQSGRFAEVLAHLENTRGCQSLSLHSFLMLPMQRITRLPLLIDAVLTRLDTQDEEHPNCKMALATLNKIVKDCNEGARRMERMEEILILSRQLEFPREVKAVPIISSTRWLVRSGELTQLVFRGDEAKLTFGKKFSKSTLHFFLFTDLLVITKRKSEECYVVTDYCPRNMAQMSSGEGLNHLPVKSLTDGGRNLMLLTMLQNHERKTVEMILSCAVESDRQRWLQATSQPMSENPEESVYEDWDCPQVTTVHPFTASQPDELSLDVSDVVNVFRKTPDGWYHGERMRDGEQGWFPGNYTVEIASAHVRAKNLKQRYRLLALSANYLETQRKDKK